MAYQFRLLEQQISALRQSIAPPPPERPKKGAWAQGLETAGDFVSSYWHYFKEQFSGFELPEFLRDFGLGSIKKMGLQLFLWGKNSGMFSLSTPLLGGLAEAAERNLGAIAIQETIAQHPRKNLFKFNDTIQPGEWKVYLAELAKNPQNSVEVLTAQYMAAWDKVEIKPESPVVITLTKLLKPQKDVTEEVNGIQNTDIEAKVKGNAEWKTQKLFFSDTVTEWKKPGELTVKKTEIDADGKPVRGSRAEELLATMTEIPSATVVTIVDGGSGTAPVSLEWRGNAKLVTWPSGTTGIDRTQLNGILTQNIPAEFSRIEFKKRGGLKPGFVIVAGIEQPTLQVLPTDAQMVEHLSIDSAMAPLCVNPGETSTLWQWNGTKFVAVGRPTAPLNPAPAPVVPAAPAPAAPTAVVP